MPISVFISYRRDGGEGFAHMFNMMLEQKGYHVFYDIESIGVGLFNQKILEEIEAADVFLILLTKGALDRCVNDDDWVRREIAHALSLDKPIIPLIFRGFDFPKSLPQDIARLPYYNGVDIGNMAYFDAKLDHLTHMIDEAARLTAKPKPKPAPTPTKTPEEWFREGNRLYDQKKYTEAVACYRKAAEAGYAKAQFNLGFCYRNGQGVPKDEAQAVDWYRRAAEQGHASAQYNLGNRYYYGQGVTQDYVQAVDWYRRAAEQGHAGAPNNLGVCYTNGQGVTQDYVQAVDWYRRSAEQGHAVAQFNLGVCYANGQGVTQDYVQAVDWYRRSAEQGYAVAQFNLGMCYECGRGVEKDLVQMSYWYRQAAEQGHAGATERLAALS